MATRSYYRKKDDTEPAGTVPLSDCYVLVGSADEEDSRGDSEFRIIFRNGSPSRLPACPPARLPTPCFPAQCFPRSQGLVAHRGAAPPAFF